MNKQADEELRKKIESLDIDFGYAVGNLGEDCKDNTVDKLMHLIEQRCFEARAEEIFSILPALGIVGDVNADQTISVEELWSYLVGRKKEHEAQLTNLQNKEEK